MAAATSVHVVTIIEPIIQHADWFFPEGDNYNIKLFNPKGKNLKSLSKHKACTCYLFRCGVQCIRHVFNAHSHDKPRQPSEHT